MAKYVKEIVANLERSNQSIEAARELTKDGYFDFAASRAYYAAFYAASAVLLSGGFEFKKHSGVIAAIHQKFVKTGKWKPIKNIYNKTESGYTGIIMGIQRLYIMQTIKKNVFFNPARKALKLEHKFVTDIF